MNDDTKLGGSWYKDYIEKIKSLEQEVARLKQEKEMLENFTGVSLTSSGFFGPDVYEENKMLKEENLKLRCCENCVHYDMETECELTAITCTNYNKWDIKK